jgi:hypothetical protein
MHKLLRLCSIASVTMSANVLESAALLHTASVAASSSLPSNRGAFIVFEGRPVTACV